jgi:signal transduction histidine kinase
VRDPVAEPADPLHRLSHALRTPIAVIQGFAELLLRDAGTLTAEQRTHYAGRIHDGAAELREILDGAVREWDGDEREPAPDRTPR